MKCWICGRNDEQVVRGLIELEKRQSKDEKINVLEYFETEIKEFNPEIHSDLIPGFAKVSVCIVCNSLVREILSSSLDGFVTNDELVEKLNSLRVVFDD